MKLTGCPVWDAPMLLIERSAVPFRGKAVERKAAGTRQDMLY